MKRGVIAISWIFISLMIYFILDANAPNKNELYPASISGFNFPTSSQPTSTSVYIKEPRVVGPGESGGIDFFSNSEDNKKNENQELKESIVYIRSSNFEPNTITIKKGEKITWINMDQSQHSIVSQGNFDSGTLQTGQSFSKVFDRTGTYDYICSFHTSMKGKIVVE